jgi:hypothetical protein
MIVQYNNTAESLITVPYVFNKEEHIALFSIKRRVFLCSKQSMMENKRSIFNKQAMMDSEGEPAAARKLPLKKRAVESFGGGEDHNGDKKPAARSSPESDAEFDACSSPEAHDQLEQALERIPDEEKTAYMEAVETAHHLIEDESNPVWFIRFEQRNFWAAAIRLVTYWKERKALFGDRAFRPLKLLTGDGALNEDDIMVLRSGALALLPKDNVGRSVLCIDRAIVTNHELKKVSRLRIAFFVLSILSENKMSQTDGFVFILRVSSRSGGDVGHINVLRFLQLIRNAMPTRMMAAHFTCCLPKGSRKTFFGTILPAAIQRHGNFFDNITVIHAAESEHNICEKLQAHCMKPEGLPETLGGTWKHAMVLQWMFADNPDWAKSCPDEASMDLPLGVPMDAHSFAADENALTASECNGSTDSVQNSSEDVYMESAEIFDSNGNAYPSLAIQAFFELEQALELIPDEEKAAYTEAMHRVPDLVDSESDPFRFLWYEKYNISAAARRLVLYWEFRKELFGERAFLPMTQLENGALSEDDVAVLQTGYLALLPDDTDGCAVVCYDGSRLDPNVEDLDGMKRRRCLFYTLSVVSEKRRACVDGFVCIEIASELSFGQSNGRFFELAEKVLPVHLKALHLVNSPPTTVVEKTFFGTIVPATVKLLGATAHRRAHVHTGKSKEEILEKLNDCGFFSEGLPECVGGMWTDDNFSNWQTERRRFEEDIHLIANVYEQYSKEPTSLDPIPMKPAPAEEGKEIEPQKRNMNIIYSRRKRVKQSLNLQALHDESTRLTLINAKLKRDNGFLEDLLANVEASIARNEHMGPATIPGPDAQHQTPLGLSTSEVPLSLSTSGVTYAQNRQPGASSFRNIGAVQGPQRSFQEEQQVLGRLANERRIDSRPLLDQDCVANIAALLAQQIRQQHGQLQLSEVVASIRSPQPPAIYPGSFYPAGFSSVDGTHTLPMTSSNHPVGYPWQEAAPQANPPGQYQNHDPHRWQPHFGQRPPP